MLYGQGRNASRSAKRPTSYLEPSLKEGSRSPKRSKHKAPYDDDAYPGYSAEGADDDGFSVDPFGADGTGLGSAKVPCIATPIVNPSLPAWSDCGAWSGGSADARGA